MGDIDRENFKGGLPGEGISIATASMLSKRGIRRREADSDFLARMATPPPCAFLFTQKMSYEERDWVGVDPVGFTEENKGGVQRT